MKARLHMVGTSYSAGGKRRLGSIDLDHHFTGITAILGPNGAGKTLFLNLCHGLIMPTSGTVSWNGVDAVEGRRNRGFVFQNTAVMRRSVAENLAFPLAAAGIRRRLRREIVDRTLRTVHLFDRADDPAAALSGGERQRMALGRAIVSDPEVLFLDEPSANLDPASTALLEEIVTRISDRGVAVLWATHDLRQAQDRSQHVLFLDRGKIAESAATTRFFSTPESQPARSYLGRDC